MECSGTPPLPIDDLAVCLLEECAWDDRIPPALESSSVSVEANALEGTRTVHERQALALIDAADTEAYGDLETESEAVVTAKWDTATEVISEPETVDQS